MSLKIPTTIIIPPRGGTILSADEIVRIRNEAKAKQRAANADKIKSYKPITGYRPKIPIRIGIPEDKLRPLQPIRKLQGNGMNRKIIPGQKRNFKIQHRDPYKQPEIRTMTPEAARALHEEQWKRNHITVPSDNFLNIPRRKLGPGSAFYPNGKLRPPNLQLPRPLPWALP